METASIAGVENVRAETPAYFGFLIAAYRSGAAGRHVHLGYWSDPPPLSAPCATGEFEAAQQKLADVVITFADMRGGHSVLDVGCGFGGMLESLTKLPSMRLTGVGNDPRQLEICRSIDKGGSSLTLVEADACALPFAPASFDRVLSVEAMFHFPSRGAFFHEAARVLVPGGRLTVTDILLLRPDALETSLVATLEATIRGEYGPWPQLWIGPQEFVEAAGAAGLREERLIDVSRETLPTYRVTAPRPWDGRRETVSAGSLLRWLHETGRLAYLCATFVKRS